jgi:integrase
LAKAETHQEKAQREGTEPTASAKGKIIEYSLWLHKEGYREATILGRTKLLKILTKRGGNLYDPESMKTVIAEQQWSEGRKANAVDAYSSFLKMVGGTWEPPRYQGIRKIPFIPTETEVDQLIAGCSSRMGTFLQLLKETGARSGEAWCLKWADIDTVTKTVRITPEKGSNPRILPITPKLTRMLTTLPQNYGDRVFSKLGQPLDHHRDHFSQQRKRIAHKLKNPRLLRITFHTLRHFKGTMEHHRTKDTFHVMQVLGHKNIKNTLLYIQLAEELFKDQQDYISKVARTEKDACALVDAGFEYVCDFENAKIFRKPKHLTG